VADLLGDGVDALGQVVDVLGGHASHRNAAILGQVNAEFFAQAGALFGVHAGEAEHADLVGDVLPVSLGSEIFLQIFKCELLATFKPTKDLTKLDLNLALTEMMRSAISLTSPSHSLFNSGVLKIVLTRRAP
jgi:hypothetical protein